MEVKGPKQVEEPTEKSSSFSATPECLLTLSKIICLSLPLSTTDVCSNLNRQDAQLSQRDRAAGALVLAKRRRLELGDNILRTL